MRASPAAPRALSGICRGSTCLGALAIQPLVTALILGLLLWGALDAILAVGSRRTVIRMEGRMPKVIFVVFALLAMVNWMYLLANGV